MLDSSYDTVVALCLPPALITFIILGVLKLHEVKNKRQKHPGG